MAQLNGGTPCAGGPYRFDDPALASALPVVRKPGMCRMSWLPRRARLAFAGLSIAAFSLPGAASEYSMAVHKQLESCDAPAIHAAAAGVLRNPETLRQPFVLFIAATAEREAGNIEEALFLYFAARVRTGRQRIVGKQDAGQAPGIAAGQASAILLPQMLADPALSRRVVGRVIEWDRTTPDPYRALGASMGGAVASELARQDADIASLPDRIDAMPEREAEARSGLELVDRLVAQMLAFDCPAKPAVGLPPASDSKTQATARSRQ